MRVDTSKWHGLAQGPRLMRLIAASLLAILAASLPVTASLFSNDTPAKGVCIPLFGSNKSKPAAQLRIGSVTIGPQRRGLFRIGILPELVGHHVEIVFSGDKIDPEALRDLTGALQTLIKAESAEFFDVSIRTAGKAEPAIRAASALVSGDRDWELTRAVVNGGQTAAKARLAIHGEHAGEVISSESRIKPDNQPPK